MNGLKLKGRLCIAIASYCHYDYYFKLIIMNAGKPRHGK